MVYELYIFRTPEEQNQNQSCDAHLDLQKLTVVDPSRPSYLLEDGDIPCTPETEPKYNFVFNFCADVTAASYPVIKYIFIIYMCSIVNCNNHFHRVAFSYAFITSSIDVLLEFYLR